jgi:hypothetical protein
VTAGHHPALLRYCTEERLIRPATLDAFRVSTAGAEALRWPLVALDPAGRWVIANARIRKCLAATPGEARDWFEVKGGPTCLAMGNHTLGQEPASWRTERPSWAPEWLGGGDGIPLPPKSLETPFPAVRRVLVTEGQWDMMTAWQLGIPNVLSLPNGAGHVDVAGLLRYVHENTEVWLAVDMDPAGDRCAEAFFGQLGGAVRRLALPYKDLNDWLTATPDLTADDVLAAAAGDVRDKPKAGRWANLVHPEPEAALPAGVVCEAPWPLLTRRLGGGWRGRQTTGLLAPSGVGKTTLVMNVLAHATKLGVKCGGIFLEGTVADTVKKLRHQIEAWCRPDMTEVDLPPYLERVLVSSLSGSTVTWEQTIEEAAEMAKAGARLLVLDNWDYIMPPDMNGERLKIKAYKAFQGVMKDHDCHGLVVWQPGKVDRTQAVNSGTQKGMSKAFQDSDVYMTMNKNGLSRRIEVEKARVDDVGDDVASVVILRYNTVTHCLDESESQADLAVSGETPKPPEKV